MTLRFEDLSAPIERNDVPAVVRLMHGASEAERRSVRTKVMELANKNWDYKGNRAAAAIAALGVAGGARQAAGVLQNLALGESSAQAVEVLAERRPPWLSALAQALLLSQSFWGDPWGIVRALVRAGLIAKPDLPEYTTRMPQSLAFDLWYRPDAEPRGKSLEQRLLDDPGLLEDEIFQLFRVEGAVRGLYLADSGITGRWAKKKSHPELSWSSTLARLARSGHIDVDRLLDECIGVFLRDMKPTHFGWYVEFHKTLAPTLDEMAARTAQYERLLASDSSLGVGVGQEALEKLMAAKRLDLESFVAASRPALSRPEKGIVSKQIRLFGQVMKQRPDLAGQVAEALEPALSHERPEIQEAARRLLGDKAVAPREPEKARPESRDGTVLARARQVMQRSSLAPQIKSCVEALESGRPAPGLSIPVGPGAQLPPPITDPAELAVAFTRLVEDAGDPIEIERAIAGAVRTARLPIEDRIRAAGPLAKRAAEQMKAWPTGLNSGEVRPMVACVAYAWSTGERVAIDMEHLKGYMLDFSWKYTSLDRDMLPVTPTGVLAVRCIEAIELIALGVPVELLAEPTHDRGAIDPAVFAERAQRGYGSWRAPHAARYDLEMAALRVRRADVGAHVSALPKEVKERYLALVKELPDGFGVRVVGARAVKQYGNNSDPIVLAQVRCVGRESVILRTLTNLEEPVNTYVRMSAEGEFASNRYGPSIKTWPLISPWLPELTFAHLLRPLSRALQTGKHDYGPAAVACLMNADTPLDSVGHVVLAIGCIGAEEDTRTAAADVFAAASKDGRLQPELMAAAWLELQRCSVFQAKRLESTLRRLMSDPASAMRVAQSLQAALGPLIEAGARDMHVLLRLATAAGEACGVVANDPRVGALAERKGGSELVASARALVAARLRNNASPAHANQEILEGLLQRAR